MHVTKEDIERGTPRDPDHWPIARPFKRLGESMRRLLQTLLICLLAPAAVALAEDNPLTTQNKFMYGALKKILLRSAEKMPERDYNFKPTDTVRSFGQIVGHVAESQYAFCSSVLGEKNPAPNIEKTKTSKADLIAALKDAFAYWTRPTTA